jgi:Ca2+-binding RTX toxin-like protein
VKRYVPAILAAAVLTAFAVPSFVRAETLAVDNPLGLDAAPKVDLSVADVVTGGVRITDPTTATVTATIDPNTVGTSYYFEYGPNGNLTFRTPTVSLGGNLDPQQVAGDLLNLVPGTLYDYRAVVSGPGGPGGLGGLSVGPTLSFQTSAAGSDAKKGSKSKCTIRGTAKRDVLSGTRKRDVICGLGGRDTIRGLGGNDVIRGGSGNDRAIGGPGRDFIAGDAGNDALYGQGGADRLFGGKGRDRLDGGKGRDQVTGGSGRDRAKIDRNDRVRSVEKATH